MKVFALGLLPLAAALVLPVAGAAASKSAPRPAWTQRVDSAMHGKGEMHSDGVLRYSLSRSDLRVRVGGVHFEPSLALDGYAAFRAERGNSGLAVGEIVLTGAQVDAATRDFSAGGLNVTALHNHLIGETPNVYFLHFDGRGDVTKLAAAVRSAIADLKIPGPDSSKGSQDTTGLNRAAITAVMKETPHVVDGVLEYTADRKEHVTENGEWMPPAMGPESEIHFQPTGEGSAVLVAELAVTATEAPHAVQFLRAKGIHVTALHNHFLSASPQIFFIHAWAQGNALDLARTVRAALNGTASK